MRDVPRTSGAPAQGVNTDLFVVASGVLPQVVLDAVPPACRRGVDVHAGLGEPAAAERVLELPTWTPRHAARHFVPALSLMTASDYTARFELSIEQGGSWSPWVASATLGGAALPPLEPASPSLHSDIDVFVASEPADRLRLRVRLHACAPDLDCSTRFIVSLSASDLAPLAAPEVGADATPVRVPVPALSQMEAPEAIRRRVCSPTCTAMVLGRWGVATDAAALAREMFHSDLDLYGVWPEAMRTAARRGIAGYLLRFPDWASVMWCLSRGVPVVASVRYASGELTGAAVEQTSGHLIVITGYADGRVLVNDPAAPTRATVPRTYDVGELARVWLERSGVGYVFFDPRDR
jgi:hypothetical protein